MILLLRGTSGAEVFAAYHIVCQTTVSKLRCLCDTIQDPRWSILRFRVHRGLCSVAGASASRMLHVLPVQASPICQQSTLV